MRWFILSIVQRDSLLVFDIAGAQLTDLTANATVDCNEKETQLMRDEKENVPFEMEITDISIFTRSLHATYRSWQNICFNVLKEDSVISGSFMGKALDFNEAVRNIRRAVAGKII
jgi:hypothetical protein